MKSTSPVITVVIPAYNSTNTLKDCLTSLQHQTVLTPKYEIIVVDDGSTDGTMDLAPVFPEVCFLSINHQGPAAARNYGVKHASGEIILFTDADCVPCEDWIEKMIAPFEQENIVGVKGAYLNLQRDLLSRFVQAEYEGKYHHMQKEKYIDFIDTYSAGYRRDVFLQYGGFDTDFRTSSVEDQELSFRIAKDGQKMVFIPDARVGHLGHANNLKDYFLKKYKIGFWKVLVHKKHPHKLVRDSHTPQSLKIQIMIIALVILALFLGLIHPLFFRISAIFGFLFFLTTLPFVYFIWRKDIQVAIVAPLMLLLRSIALGLGFGYGVIQYFVEPKSLLTSIQPPDVRK